MSEPFVVVDVDEGLERILRSLQKLPDQLAAPQVLQKALNTTARKARTRLIKEAGKRYALSKPEALKTESKVEASTSDTSAAIISKGSMRDFMDFLTQPNSDTCSSCCPSFEQRLYESAGKQRNEGICCTVRKWARRNSAASSQQEVHLCRSFYPCRRSTAAALT